MMDLGALGRALFGARQPAAAAGGITRTAAAQVCADALRKRGLPAMVHAPRGDAGRVAVVVGLLRRPQIVQLGWLEVPLSGAIEWNDHGSALASQATPLVLSIVRSCMEKRRVIPVAPDPRVFEVSDDVRVMQAATGAWQVVGRGGAVRATLETPELAVQAARGIGVERAAAGAQPVGAHQRPE
jgi:hypothetical protein